MVYTWARVPTCRERARAPIGLGVVLRMYRSARVVCAVVGSYYACIVAHTCSNSTRSVVSNSRAGILIAYSTRHALSDRCCTGTVSEASSEGLRTTSVLTSKLGQARRVPFAPNLRPFDSLRARWLLTRYQSLPFTHHGATARNRLVRLSLFASSPVLDLIAPRVRFACSLCQASASHPTQGGEELSHTSLCRWAVRGPIARAGVRLLCGAWSANPPFPTWSSKLVTCKACAIPSTTWRSGVRIAVGRALRTQRRCASETVGSEAENSRR